MEERSALYNNTVDDVTSINLNTNLASITSTANLYKAKAGLTGDAMPFELVEERVLVGVDMLNNPEVFSSLAGNSVDIFKIDFELSGTGAVQVLFGEFNGDQISSVQTNVLRSFGSSVIAETFLSKSAQVCYLSTDPTIFSLYIYPKSGTERAFLLKCGTQGADGLQINHAYWTNTADEMDSFLFRGVGSNLISGTIRLSKLIAN